MSSRTRGLTHPLCGFVQFNGRPRSQKSCLGSNWHSASSKLLSRWPLNHSAINGFKQEPGASPSSAIFAVYISQWRTWFAKSWASPCGPNIVIKIEHEIKGLLTKFEYQMKVSLWELGRNSSGRNFGFCAAVVSSEHSSTNEKDQCVAQKWHWTKFKLSVKLKQLHDLNCFAPWKILAPFFLMPCRVVRLTSEFSAASDTDPWVAAGKVQAPTTFNFKGLVFGKGIAMWRIWDPYTEPQAGIGTWRMTNLSDGKKNARLGPSHTASRPASSRGCIEDGHQPDSSLQMRVLANLYSGAGHLKNETTWKKRWIEIAQGKQKTSPIAIQSNNPFKKNRPGVLFHFGLLHRAGHLTNKSSCKMKWNKKYLNPPSLRQVFSAVASQAQCPTQTSRSEVGWFEKFTALKTCWFRTLNLTEKNDLNCLRSRFRNNWEKGRASTAANCSIHRVKAAFATKGKLSRLCYQSAAGQTQELSNSFQQKNVVWPFDV